MRLPGPPLVEVREPAFLEDDDSARAAERVRERVSDGDALASLSTRLTDSDPNVRLDAVSDLGLLNDPRAEWLLAIAAAQDPEPSVRAEALYALGSLQTESQFATFQIAIRDSDREVRSAAVGALEDLGGDASVDILRIALTDADPSIRLAADEALNDLGVGDGSVP